MNIFSSLKMVTAQVVETSFTLNNSPIQGCIHPDNHAQPYTYEMTLVFEPSTVYVIFLLGNDSHS